MKTILLHIHADAGQESRLQAALDLTRATDGHLICLQPTPFRQYVSMDIFGGAHVMPGVLEAVREEEARVRQRVEGQLAGENISWEWRAVDGDTVDALEKAARLADVVVVSLADAMLPIEENPADIAGTLAMHAPCPVLAIPVGAGDFRVADIVMVAWDGSREAGRALRLATPLLCYASTVHVVTVSRDDSDLPDLDAVAYLSRHGIAAELHSWPAKGRSVEEVLCAASGELSASWMVMGAYGHSRLREIVFGGVTKFILKQAPLPLLLAH